VVLTQKAEAILCAHAQKVSTEQVVLTATTTTSRWSSGKDVDDC
jgi:hypothetical protein